MVAVVVVAVAVQDASTSSCVRDDKESRRSRSSKTTSVMFLERTGLMVLKFLVTTLHALMLSMMSLLLWMLLAWRAVFEILDAVAPLMLCSLVDFAAFAAVAAAASVLLLLIFLEAVAAVEDVDVSMLAPI